MEWRDAVTEVAKYAPAVATALGGPAAGGVTAGAAQMVTSALGVENSPAGLVAATQDPEKRAELQRINNEHRRELERMRLDAEAAQAAEVTARLTETNKTMRAELQHDGWYKSGWRPLAGYAFTASLFGLALVVIVAIARDPSLLSEEHVMAVLAWLIATLGAAVGINVRERSKDKARQLGQEPGSFMDAVKTKVK
ncbi:3TM-type holin [Halomonas elongata]|uniref:3TM-type holin n=1 Tax=Halomonas elongata TaxID=2746 RepID=UPI00186B607A|nr:3TM-type holin [Halomonas elongata]MBW5800076.1 holin family protein [Halomonas elongata]